MRDLDRGATVATTGGTAALTAPTTAEIELFTRRLAVDAPEREDAARIDRIAALERLRRASEGAQAETTADFVVSQRQLAGDRGVPAERRDRGLAAQVALARHESPRRGQQAVDLSMVVRTELPATRIALRTGRIDGYRATLIARETACLSAEHRAAVDEELGSDLDALEALAPGQLLGRLQKAAAELDPASVAQRRRTAEAQRHTSIRPAPDTMTWFGALLGVRDGVSVHAVLDREARRLKAAGDERSIGQLKADLLVQRVVHPEVCGCADPATSRVPVTIDLVVRDSILLGDAEGTGWVDGHGPVPGDLQREWVADHLESGVDVWLRRVYEQPSTGRLVTMDSSATFFTGALAAFLRIRDRVCRTPGCGAAIRHRDHVVPRAEGGPTTADNGQGTCETCNYAKAADGWSARPRPGPRHTVETTTPTGHTYTSTAEVL